MINHTSSDNILDSIKNGFFNLFGNVTVDSDGYTPASSAGLSWHLLDNIYATNPTVKKNISVIAKNINANNWTVNCNMFRSESRNEAVKDLVESYLKKQEINSIIKNSVILQEVFGNAYLTFNSDKELIVQDPSNYQVYYNKLDPKKKKYALIKNGREERGSLGNLQNMRDLAHLKHPATQYKPLGISPSQVAYQWILFYQHVVEANNKLVSRGWVNATIALIEKELFNAFQQKDDGGKTFAEALGEKLASLFGGSKNAGKTAVLPGIKEILELGKTNKEMALTELFDIAVKEIIYAFGGNPVDLGMNATYNTAQTFNYAQFDEHARSHESQIETAINQYILRYGLANANFDIAQALENGDLAFSFNQPKDPDEQKKVELELKILESTVGLSASQEYKIRLINEFREKAGREPLDITLLQNEPQNANNETVSENFNQKTLVTQALDSREYERETKSGQKKGFKPHLSKKIEKQINDVLEQASKKKV